jgi:Raf kinase inhibitor-like YbhB/YbcL family protein
MKGKESPSRKVSAVRAKLLCLGLLPLLLLCGCSKEVPTMQLTSSAFKEGETIPRDYTGDGKDVSPPLRWSGAPEKTRALALLCEDPDAPRGLWVHWVLFNVPTAPGELAEAIPTNPSLPDGARQGKNDFGKIGYGGPKPPQGQTHRYYFRIYALDTVLDLKEGATRQQLLDAMKGHILAEGQLMGKYAR